MDDHSAPHVPDQGTEQAATDNYRAALQLIRERDFTGAQKELAVAVRLQPQYPEALRALSLVFKALNQPDKAARFAQAALNAALRLKRHDTVQELFRLFGKAKLPVENPYRAPAETLLAKGSLEAARRCFELGLELTPDQGDLAAGFTRALVAAGNQERAHRFLHSFLRQHPHDAAALGARTLIPELPLDSTLRKERGSVDAVLKEAEEAVAEADDTPLPEGFEFEVGRHGKKGQPCQPAAGNATVPVLDDTAEAKGREKRRSPRVPLAEYFLSFSRRKDPLAVVDICREGVGFKTGEDRFQKGQELQFDLMSMGRVKIKKLKVVVRHQTGRQVGCEFVNLSAKQRAALDELLFKDDHCSSDPLPELPTKGGKLSFDVDSW